MPAAPATVALTITTRDAALSYDRWFDTPWGRYAFAVERAAIEEAAGPFDGQLVLDVGCGTGRFMATFEGHAQWAAGIDLDPNMLTVASTRVGGPLLAADAHQLPICDAAFDVTIAVTLCEFTANPALVVNELARVTRPGGRIVIGALNPRSPWGLGRRRRLQRQPWQAAHFLARRQLVALGATHGRSTLRSSLFTPAPPPTRWVGPMLEAIGRRAFPALGAFYVLVIEKAPA